jgi:hypothetical protein
MAVRDRNNHTPRKELRARYEQTRTEAGVYCIRNSRTGKILLGSAPNLASVRNKLDFARSTGTASALDRRLSQDARAFGIEAFSMEVLDVLEVTPERTDVEILADLAALEALWRERFDPSLLY